MQAIKVALLQQSSYQEMIRFFLKEADHFSVTPAGDSQQVETLIINPDGLSVQMRAQQAIPFQKNRPTPLSSEDRRKLFQVKQIIEQDFLHEHTIASLCRQGGLNDFKLKSGFKTLFNTRVIQYVRQLRMEYAQRLLRDRSASVAEVARQLGFSYPNHFSAAYKRHFGKLPSQR